MNNTIFLNKEIEVLIVSAGGVGTTFLMEEIRKYKTTNCSSNSDGFKHLPLPPISFRRDLKVVYIFGNPILASMSLFRRNYHHIQSKKAQQYLSKGFTITSDMSLEAYAAQEKEGHYFERHFRHWQATYSVYSTLFVQYETLFENIATIAHFLDLPAAFVEQFPQKKTRQSSLNSLSEATQIGLKKKYGALQEKWANLPTTFELSVDELKGKSSFLAKPYQRGFWKWFWKKMPLLRKLKNKLN